MNVDLSYVFKAAKERFKNTQKKKILITKSTVPVGTGDKLKNYLRKRKNIEVISNPEFLREGEAVRDFRYPDRIVVGSNDKKFFNLKKTLSPLINKGANFFTATSRRGAELIKYSSNAFLATKITFINELANLCEKAGLILKISHLEWELIVVLVVDF